MAVLGRSILGVVVATCLMVVGPPSVWAEAPSPTEYQLKAVFLVRFAQFVDFPPEAFADESGGFVVGVLGDDPFGAYLDGIARDELVNGRRLVVRRFTTADEAVRCHILFVSKSESEHLGRILGVVQDKSILTVGETAGFSERGGVVNFVVVDNKLRYEINVDAAKRAHLAISSKMLKLARGPEAAQ